LPLDLLALRVGLSTLCPLPAEADMRGVGSYSGFDVVDGARSRRRIAVR